MNKKPLRLLFLCGALIALVLINHVFITIGLYLQISWLDMLMHFLGGFFFGLIGIYLLSFRFNTRQKIPFFLAVAASLIIAFIVGCLWEIIEFNSETVFQLKLAEVINYEDTQSDLFFDVIGALAGAVYFILMKDKTGRKSSPLLDKKDVKNSKA